MAIKTSDLNAKLFGKANKRRATTPTEAQTAAKENAQVIELAVAGQEMVSFQLQRIAASDIETQTVVFSDNAREQTFLNEHALSDILDTLKERGQQYPAVGRKNAQGQIEVLDGSRRRKSCILANKDFLIYVADDINSEHAKFLSDVANAHKPLSLYERGREMQAKLDSGDISDQKGLAALFKCSEALVSGALKAASLPLPLLQAYPNVTELGRPTIVKLHKQFNELEASAQQGILDKCQQGGAYVWQRFDGMSEAKITKQVSILLESWIAELNQTIHKEAKKPIELVKGKANYIRKGQSLSLNLKKVDDSLAQEIIQFIESKLR
ncbi:chromosome partitioning protein ParB [Vibrio sp. UCD-FRSSP16_10]|uniref:ParB/RepB/Spo0J family partition protein n=1 Tax=unclassified Vibrio TaxID=2614977 RepID=UPI0007FCE5C3|nr:MULTISPECIES: ParB/RepB/Spo0J family partition protein [unclassified Vibrio]OBT17001.1 chromosome partitioning protein ParB [Vibrio sp. UCD-FRSSP16_30]OBT21992.1 chromosome partitioning protein ParB [Vibrio sp. UCD-FRSSP16_10]